MWVPIVSIAWSIVYLVQNRLRITETGSSAGSLTTTTVTAATSTARRNLRGECLVLVPEPEPSTKITALYAHGIWRGNFNTVFLMAFVSGLETGWASPSLAKLISINSTLPINEYQASWIASLLNTGRSFGAVLGLISTEYLGSKTSLIYNAYIHGIGMICLLYVYSVNWLYASRFIVGLGSGMWASIFPIYIGEISNPKIRGALVCLISIGMLIGFIFGNIIGAYTEMWIFGTISLVPVLLFLILFMWFPKTPHFLVLKGQIDDALISIEWYQRDANAIVDLVSIKNFVEEKRFLKATDYIKDLMLPFNRIALIKVNTVHFLLQMSGFCTVSYYMEIILTQAQVTLMDTALAVPTIAGTALIGGVISIYTCDKLGRKVLLSTSSMCIALTTVRVVIVKIKKELSKHKVNTSESEDLRSSNRLTLTRRLLLTQQFLVVSESYYHQSFIIFCTMLPLQR
ncbi:hypothetical protein KQX54_020690 [Cotesia glomerata]|uniref:Major facilitator superfamily (MFS) profile domain-containing protein n=1 Tax=Cotesia glomerata TaxID=32391 RepID=A0AAV7J7X2_COTGL|nr:hypothetical protein KQX54_020690 [Cotesia glomerata]